MLRELATVAVGLQVGEVDAVQLDIAWERRSRQWPLRPSHHRLSRMRWATFAASLGPDEGSDDHTVYCVSEHGYLAELLPDAYRHRRVIRLLSRAERLKQEAFLRNGLRALHRGCGEAVADGYWLNLYR